jgi:hypothetical protein
MSTSKDNWLHEGDYNEPAKTTPAPPPSWNDADPNADGDGLGLLYLVLLVGSVSLVIFVWAFMSLLIG